MTTPTTPPDVPPGGPPEHTYRLPRTVLPRRYEVELDPDIPAARFSGRVRVEVDVVEPVTELVLNAAELEIDDAWLEAAGGGDRVAATVALDDTLERATVTPDRTLPAGSWVLQLAFRGVLNDKLRGFYRSVYTDADGNEQVLATSQLESTDARRAFPCWDEPDFKAIFSITLVVDEGLTAISNAAEVESTSLGGGRRRVRFADTMVMSTYLVAFIVGRLDVSETVTAGEHATPIRIITPPGKLHLTGFALELAPFCLEFFERYYGIAYPGDKLDLIAIPDFAAGAMENLGAVTFRDTALLVDPESATRNERERVADVVAHEIAHMWFGDLVTMKWWNGIWLNEAFATLMELLAVDAFRPEWGRWVTQSEEKALAYDIDALSTTRAVEYPVRLPSDAEGMFDWLTYYKGASVLRMLEQYLGSDRFRDGIRLYLDTHRYGNTETSDLWDALEEATGEPCRRIMDSWIFAGGVPVVTVERGDSDRRLVLRQSPLGYAGAGDPPAGREWPVPLILRTDHTAATDGPPSGEHRVLLEGAGATLEVDAPIEAVVANAGGHGYYRVEYGDDLRQALVERVGALPPIERYAVVNDSWALVLAGRLPATAFVDLARHFDGERDRRVWNAVLGVDATTQAGLRELYRILPPADRPGLERLVVELTGDAAEELGWEAADGEDELVRQCRGLVLAGRGALGHDEGTENRARQVLGALAAGDAVDPEVAAASATIVAHLGTGDDRSRFEDLYRRAATPQQEVRFLLSMGDIPGVALADRTLEMAVSGDVRTQNAPILIRRLLMNLDLEVGIRAWEFVKDRWPKLVDAFPSNLTIRMVEGVQALSTPELAHDVAEFFEDHPLPQQQTVLQILERLRVNVALREREATELARHLR